MFGTLSNQRSIAARVALAVTCGLHLSAQASNHQEYHLTLSIETSLGEEDISMFIELDSLLADPHPPGSDGSLNLSTPEIPLFSFTNPTNSYSMSFGVGRPNTAVAFYTPQAFPDFFGQYMFSFELIDGYPGGSEFFDVFIDLESTGGSISNASWYMFNPQPDPPLWLLGFGFDVPETTGLRSDTGVSFDLQVVNRVTGDIGSFSLVPSPGALAVLLVAGGMTRRRRRRASF